MNRKIWLAFVVCALPVAGACSRQSGNLGSPSSTAPQGLGAAADGTTLKGSAPVAVSPMNALKLDPATQPVLVVNNSTLQYGTSPGMQYRFQVFNAAGVIVFQSLVNQGSSSTTSVTVTSTLDADQTYSWWARGELSG